MPTAPINGVNIHYESHGGGFPLVLTSGLGGNTGNWAGQVPAFSQHYRFIAWDPRGHGGSDSPPHREQYGIQVSAQDLGALLDHLEIERAYVGGLSMGGAIAVRFTLDYPQRVAALLIMDSASASGLPLPPDAQAMLQHVIELAESQGMEAVADYSIQADPDLKTRAAARPESLATLRQGFLSLDPGGYANTIRSLMEPDFSTERLSEIAVPTLVLAGEGDPAQEAAHLTQSKISGSRYEVIPGAGHLSNLDEPEEFNSRVLEFLRSVDAPKAQ